MEVPLFQCEFCDNKYIPSAHDVTKICPDCKDKFYRFETGVPQAESLTDLLAEYEKPYAQLAAMKHELNELDWALRRRGE